ncbi:MAG: MscL family protein [Candidatus Saccharibacteria bacterium]|nr:MscL family protein [Candidatus Saccharibacteria bacterium]
MNKQLAGFMEFVRTQGVVGLAVGLAIGTQVGEMVKSIVNGLINPIVGMIVGNQDGLLAAKFTLTIGGRSGDFMWGSVFSALITLLAVSAVIYYVVRGLKLDKLDKAKAK